MRRDLHKWFLAGIVVATGGSFSIYLFLQNTQAAITGLVACYALLGILYLDVARVPERGWLIAAVGLSGKILGPLGLFWQIWHDSWPASTLVLCITNDFVWWIPFALYLHDAWPAFRLDAMRRA